MKDKKYPKFFMPIKKDVELEYFSIWKVVSPHNTLYMDRNSCSHLSSLKESYFTSERNRHQFREILESEVALLL